jgi:hypothetical protein
MFTANRWHHSFVAFAGDGSIMERIAIFANIIAPRHRMVVAAVPDA